MSFAPSWQIIIQPIFIVSPQMILHYSCFSIHCQQCEVKLVCDHSVNRGARCFLRGVPPPGGWGVLPPGGASSQVGVLPPGGGLVETPRDGYCCGRYASYRSGMHSSFKNKYMGLEKITAVFHFRSIWNFINIIVKLLRVSKYLSFFIILGLEGIHFYPCHVYSDKEREPMITIHLI